MVERDQTVLLVDDDENILSSLQRVFRSDGYHVMTATSGKQGLEALEENDVWLVVSDNAMPGMNGIDFFREVRARWPDTVRIMLTGYADLDSAMEAINRGEVYRFVAKPWDPDELRLLVSEGLDQHRLIRENREMHVLIEEQNTLLRQWNERLQQTVEERTEELREKNSKLEEFFQQLKGSFVNSIKIFTGLIELRNPVLGGHVRRVSSLSASIASQMDIAEDQVKNFEVAALLHDIGKIGLPDDVLKRDEKLMSPNQRALVKQHPVVGQAILETIDDLESVGTLVRHHHERWDGKGYPDGIGREDIPVGSRIIALADSVDHYVKAGTNTASDFIGPQLDAFYKDAFDPSVVLALKTTLDGSSLAGQAVKIAVGIGQLREGMVLAQDLRTITGILLIPEGETLKQSYLDKLIAFERQKLIPSTAYIQNRTE